MSVVPSGAPSTGTRRISSLFAGLLLVFMLMAGTLRPADAAATHNPFGYIGTLAFTNGFVVVGGWAVDPDTAGPVRIEIVVDGLLSGAVSAAGPRADVAAAYPKAGPNHGYYTEFRKATGSHVVCVIGVNVGLGSNTIYGCRRITVNNDPIGALDFVRLTPGGVHLVGWVLDPNSSGPTQAWIYADGHLVTRLSASVARADVAAAHPYYGGAHGFDTVIPAADGLHNICAYGWNIAPGSAGVLLGCETIKSTRSPLGALRPLARTPGNPTYIPLSGWALDPDTAGVIGVRITVDGQYLTAARADIATPSLATSYPEYGTAHGFGGAVAVDGGVHTVCVVAVNVGTGADQTLGCQLLPSTGDTSPAAPTSLAAWPGNGRIDLSWTAPRAAGGGIGNYTITANPGNRTQTATGSATGAAVTGLTNGTRYTFTVRATNAVGTGSPATITGVPSAIPAQLSPAPVSTSHYLRNLTGAASSDAALMRAMGARDAAANPSNHKYLILLQIGGQDEYRGGVMLSATSRYISYAASVNAVKAYLDGYHTTQKAFAPMMLAVGTNNDIDVSSSAGASWARNVVNPLVSYAARYPDLTVSGADDIEPGFSASAAQSRAWVSGYLGATGARLVFNGSADGCSTGASGSRCNNGWTMADLQWVSGGAASSRISSLPQIYNYAMPLQWKYISLTGTNSGKPKVNFSGPLTEVTACSQAGGSCGSITNVSAWNSLWSAISSTPATRQADLPNGTDLRIN